MGITSFTSYSSRSTLNNAVLLALPTYFMCVVQLPVEIIDKINKYRRHCFWRGSNVHKKGNCLAAWSKDQWLKSQEGLGIILTSQLRIKPCSLSICTSSSTKSRFLGLISPGKLSTRFHLLHTPIVLEAHSGGELCVGSLINIEAMQRRWLAGVTQCFFGRISGILVHCSSSILVSFLLHENQIVWLVAS
jgi:hypothetical protein